MKRQVINPGAKAAKTWKAEPWILKPSKGVPVQVSSDLEKLSDLRLNFRSAAR